MSMNETDEWSDDNGNPLKNNDQEYHDCDDDDDDDHDHDQLTKVVGTPSPTPAEIKLKIKKSLLEFRCKVEDAILGNHLLGQSYKREEKNLRDITLWGVPLLPSKAHEGTDVILAKFLKAKDFRVNDAYDMLQKTMIWRSKNNIDGILDEDLGSEFEKDRILDSRDKEGRPVCYHLFGVFRDKLLYKNTFGTQKRCEKYLRWRIQLIEIAVKKLCFNGGVDSIIQVYDLRNTPSQGLKELNSLSKKAFVLFQNYYPEIIFKNIIVYAPFWFYTSQVLFSRFMHQRYKKKFILARPQHVTQTLVKYIAPEHLPAEYGGLRRNSDSDFSPDDKVYELRIKGNSASKVEFPIVEAGVTIMWDVTVVGWDVTYKEEFIPDDEGSYKVLLQNQSIVGESTRNSFYISEPGKILITVENWTFKKKRMYYRSKQRITVPMFILQLS